MWERREVTLPLELCNFYAILAKNIAMSELYADHGREVHVKIKVLWDMTCHWANSTHQLAQHHIPTDFQSLVAAAALRET
jgi:hypothetical protein